jgi:hypothetical protein
MSELKLDTTPETCEYVNDLEESAREARRKAASAGWSTPNGLVYAEVSLSLRRILHQHTQKGHCGACSEDETRRRAAASIAGLTQDSSVLGYSAVTQ